jgi:hypothetical protein
MNGASGSRHINGIQTLLIKEYYPGLVFHKGELHPPMKWEHFYSITLNGETVAVKIKRELWVSVFIAPHFSILHIRWTSLKQ